MKRKIPALLLSLVCVWILAGCSGRAQEAAEKPAVCFVVANTACAQGLNFSSPLVQDTVYDAIRNYGTISVVSVDGAPEAVCSQSFDIDERYKSASEEKLDREARSNAALFTGILSGVIADDAEADYLEALRLATRALSSLEGTGSKSIVVVGTGLGTSGLLNFQNNLLSAEPEAIVELLEEQGEIPDFSSISVFWQQMADVAPPQDSLSAAQKTKLLGIYAAIVEAGGGSFSANDMMPLPVDETVSYPKMSTVTLPAAEPIAFEPETLRSEDPLREPVVLTEEQVRFVPDEASYLEPEKAMDVLQPIADYLMESRVKVLLCGTAAGDENTAFAQSLSKKRAAAVMDSLTQLGVDPGQIAVLGLGSRDPWHVYGVGVEGEAASGNRKVVLLDADSELGRSLLSQTERI